MQQNEEFAMIVHDIRKPLAAIELFLRAIGSTESVEKKMHLLKSSSQIQRSVQKANTLLDNLLGSSSEIITRELCYIEQFISTALKDLQDQFAEKNIRFTYDLKVRTLMVDRQKIERVFSNLITNAIEAMPSEGEISFSTSYIEIDSLDFVKITIANSESYIPPELREQIFKPFVTLNKNHGTGLGLAICEKLIRFHGGQISCSSSLNLGTQFSFLLPAGTEAEGAPGFTLPTHSTCLGIEEPCISASKDDMATQQEIVALLDNKPLTMAIIDDDEIYTDMLCKQIKKLTCGLIYPVVASTFLEGFRLVLKELPQIILIDLDLKDPIFNGIDLIKSLRDNKYDGMVCLHSSHASTNLFLKSFEAGADLSIPKPLVSQNLTHAIKFLPNRKGKDAQSTLLYRNFINEDGSWNFSAETALDLIPYPVFSKNRDGRYQVCNQSFATQILGLPKSQIGQRNFLELIDRIPAELAATYRRKDEELFASKGVQNYSAEVLCADGIRREVTYFKKAILDKNGDCVGLCGIMLPSVKWYS